MLLELPTGELRLARITAKSIYVRKIEMVSEAKEFRPMSILRKLLHGKQWIVNDSRQAC